VGQIFGENDDPDAALKPNADLSHFFDLEVTGARRATATLESWWDGFRGCATLDDAAAGVLAETLLRERLDALDAAEARARHYTPQPPERQVRNWWILVGAVAVLLVALLLVVRRLRRHRVAH
jgi:hypothetical protein